MREDGRMDEATLKKNARNILRSRRIFFADVQGSRFTTNGFPDIVAVIGGLFIGLEFKTYRGKQSQDQKDFQARLEEARLEEAGGLYFIIRSEKDLLDALSLFD